MQESRIADLLDPFLGPKDQRPDTPGLLRHISIYIDILQRWNARVNLTAIRNEDEIVTRHFGESLFVARHLFPIRVASDLQPEPGDFAPLGGISPGSSARKDFELADIGSGAGFPGIPIKLWAPNISLTLIESNHKKATFLREVARALTLANVDIQTARAESLTEASFDVVTIRAVERFESILPIAERLLSGTGRLALLIGRAQLSQAQSTLPSLHWSNPAPIPNSQSRLLVVATVVDERHQTSNKW